MRRTVASAAAAACRGPPPAGGARRPGRAERARRAVNHPAPTSRKVGTATIHASAVAGEPDDRRLGIEAEPNRCGASRPATGLRDLATTASSSKGPSSRAIEDGSEALAVLQGVVTGRGNSDSHRAGELPGLTRNYVAVETRRQRRFDEARSSRRAGGRLPTSGQCSTCARRLPAGRAFRRAYRERCACAGAGRGCRWSGLIVHSDAGGGLRPHRARRDAGVPSRSSGWLLVVEGGGHTDATWSALAPGFRRSRSRKPSVAANGDGVSGARRDAQGSAAADGDPLRSGLVRDDERLGQREAAARSDAGRSSEAGPSRRSCHAK